MRRIAITLILSAFGLGLGLGLSPSTALAEQEWEKNIDRHGPYVAVAGAAAELITIEDTTPTGTSPRTDPGVSAGMNLFGGYRFSDWIAAEASVEWLRHEIQVKGPSAFDPSADSFTVTVGARAYPLTIGNGEFYAAAGVGFMDYNGDETDFAARFGLGLNIYLTEKVGMTAGATYVLPTGDLEDFIQFGGQAGLFYQF